MDKRPQAGPCTLLQVTDGRHGLQFLELRKPEGIGLESWRKVKKLLKQHPALAGQAGGGVLVITKEGKLSVKKTGSYHGDQV